MSNPPAVPALANAMSVDVEEHFQVSAFDAHVPRADWRRLPSRVEANTERVLELFGQAGASATFFVLGWIAERHPGLTRTIAAAGHEVASHGYDHTRATEQSPGEFAQDVTRSKRILEDVTGGEVKGYRAPSFSIAASNPWVWEVLQDAGYAYSSSVYPIRHDHYGLPGAPRGAYHPHGRGILEIPVSTVRAFGNNWPCGGGGYFRLLPSTYSHWAIRQLNRREGVPAVFYLHPWELDPHQPRQAGLSWKARFRHYKNLDRMRARLERLLQICTWRRMDGVFLGTGEASAA